MMQNDPDLYGILIEFKTPEALISASKKAYEAGFRQLDAYTPYPIEELEEALGLKQDSVAFWTLLGGLSGGILAFSMQWYSNVIDYPINIGGRPDFSWPAFIPITFELTILGAALCAAFSMLALNGLPEPWHPFFQCPAFIGASKDRFFLSILATDPLFHSHRIRELLQEFQFQSFQEVKLNE